MPQVWGDIRSSTQTLKRFFFRFPGLCGSTLRGFKRNGDISSKRYPQVRVQSKSLRLWFAASCLSSRGRAMIDEVPAVSGRIQPLTRRVVFLPDLRQNVLSSEVIELQFCRSCWSKGIDAYG